MNRLLISAAHKSSGKTTITLGLCAAMTAGGKLVQPFKKGPDYIDPMWLGMASQRPCHNLDFFLSAPEEITATFVDRGSVADICLIEGNKGLYDGLDLDGSNSNAALATLLRTPVILVIDARGITRGVAPLILGYQAFDPGIQIAGIILNQLGGSRHEAKLRAVIEHYTEVPVLGAVHRDPEMEIVERHLGLIPSNESREAREKIAYIGNQIAKQVELDRLLALAAGAPSLPTPRPGTDSSAPVQADIRLGIARDAAFGFYYPADLEALEQAGATLVPVDTLQDPHLPAIDALFIGGGFPETHLDALEQNQSLRREIRDAIESGLPVYAECGGLMYLARSLTWGRRRRKMVGVIPGDVVMHERPVGRGYTRLQETGTGPWPLVDADGRLCEFPAHEFHYSSLENLDPKLEFAYDVKRGMGVDGRRDGILYKNLLASYVHQRDVAGNHWTSRFIDFVRRCKHTRSNATEAAR